MTKQKLISTEKLEKGKRDMDSIIRVSFKEAMADLERRFITDNVGNIIEFCHYILVKAEDACSEFSDKERAKKLLEAAKGAILDLLVLCPPYPPIHDTSKKVLRYELLKKRDIKHLKNEILHVMDRTAQYYAEYAVPTYCKRCPCDCQGNRAISQEDCLRIKTKYMEEELPATFECTGCGHRFAVDQYHDDNGGICDACYAAYIESSATRLRK